MAFARVVNGAEHCASTARALRKIGTVCDRPREVGSKIHVHDVLHAWPPSQ